MSQIAEIVNCIQAGLHLTLGHRRIRGEGAVLGVDIGPFDTKATGACWDENSICLGSVVGGLYRYGRALPVIRDIVGGFRPDLNFVNEALNDRVADLFRRGVNPGEILIGDACGKEIGGGCAPYR